MSVLVTGAGGQVGYELALRLGPNDHALGHRELAIADAAAAEREVAHLRPSAVINAAAYTTVDRAEHEAALAEAVNAIGPANLAAACNKYGAALLHVSTDYVFDGAKHTPYVETDAPNPQSVYGATKWRGEQAVRATLGRHIILRLSWVFSAHGHNFVKTILRLARERDELRIVVDQNGAPTPAASVPEVLLTLAQRVEQDESLLWGVYHYAGTPDTTWYGLASRIVAHAHASGLLHCAVSVSAISTAEDPMPAPRPANSRLVCCKAEQQLSLMRPDWEAALAICCGSQRALRYQISLLNPMSDMLYAVTIDKSAAPRIVNYCFSANILLEKRFLTAKGITAPIEQSDGAGGLWRALLRSGIGSVLVKTSSVVSGLWVAVICAKTLASDQHDPVHNPFALPASHVVPSSIESWPLELSSADL